MSHADLKIARPEGEKWNILTMANNSAAIACWVKSLDGSAVQVVLEATGTYSNKVAHALHRGGIAFSIVTPRQASQFSGVLKTSPKTTSAMPVR